MHVGGCVRKVPEGLIKQLKVGGQLIIAEGERDCDRQIVLITRVDEAG